jgi:hypothetical protein
VKGSLPSAVYSYTTRDDGSPALSGAHSVVANVECDPIVGILFIAWYIIACFRLC